MNQIRRKTTVEIHGVTNNPVVGTALVKRVESGETTKLYFKPGCSDWKTGDRDRTSTWKRIENEGDFWNLESALASGRSRLLERRDPSAL